MAYILHSHIFSERWFISGISEEELNWCFRFKKRCREGSEFISPVVYCRSDRLIQVYFICFVLLFSYTKEHFCISRLVFTYFFHRFWSIILLELLPHQQRQHQQTTTLHYNRCTTKNQRLWVCEYIFNGSISKL